MKLLGPEPLSPLAKRRFGDYIGIAIKPVTLKYKAPQHMARPDHLGYHAGLSPAEMRIPLIVARVYLSEDTIRLEGCDESEIMDGHSHLTIVRNAGVPPRR